MYCDMCNDLPNIPQKPMTPTSSNISTIPADTLTDIIITANNEIHKYDNPSMRRYITRTRLGYQYRIISDLNLLEESRETAGLVAV